MLETLSSFARNVQSRFFFHELFYVVNLSAIYYHKRENFHNNFKKAYRRKPQELLHMYIQVTLRYHILIRVRHETYTMLVITPGYQKLHVVFDINCPYFLHQKTFTVSWFALTLIMCSRTSRNTLYTICDVILAERYHKAVSGINFLPNKFGIEYCLPTLIAKPEEKP